MRVSFNGKEKGAMISDQKTPGIEGWGAIKWFAESRTLN